MKILPILILPIVFAANILAQNCPETARVVTPVLSESAEKVYDAKLAEAKVDFEKTPNASIQ